MLLPAVLHLFLVFFLLVAFLLATLFRPRFLDEHEINESTLVCLSRFLDALDPFNPANLYLSPRIFNNFTLRCHTRSPVRSIIERIITNIVRALVLSTVDAAFL